MAHETLKTFITNNIKTNGQNAITAQILQDVLIAMVDDYPDLSGYATRTWVQQQDYAPKEWVQQQGYVTSSALSGYLPLTGGTLIGVVNFINTYGSGSIFVDSTDYDLNITASNSIYLNAERGVGVNGKITANTFEKSDGTSVQFLKADGSVDSNAYITASALSGYATRTWVTNQLGDYLSLTGGTMQGVLFFADENEQVVRGEIFGDQTGLSIQVAGSGILSIENAIETDSTIKTEGFIKRGGTANQVLCADGSVKTISELKAALDAL